MLGERSGDGAPRVLNVGGYRSAVALPEHFSGWRPVLLDIDPRAAPDLLCDARELLGLPPGGYDAVYCSHNLEHYYLHDVPKVLGGFLHVLKDEGFAEIRVPDLAAVARRLATDRLDLDDVLYQAPAGPIRVIDVIYGWAPEIAKSGNDFFAHKTGFSLKTLGEALLAAGFADVWNVAPFGPYELRALAFKTSPTPAQRRLLGLPLDDPPAVA
jgi:hypothetical protein